MGYALVPVGWAGRQRAGATAETIGTLPVAALRLDDATVTALGRLGLRQIRDLAATPRAPLTRRFGPGLLMRLDQAFGTVPEQVSTLTRDKGAFDDLISRIGVRIGLENIRRFLPADSHIPERSFIIAAAGYSEPAGVWHSPQPRPLTLFPPEPVAATGPTPPETFRWRGMVLTTGRATGPERIAPEWWLPDDNWRSGLRDYWRVETRQGRRLWLFHTPQSPGSSWYVQGEFA